MRNMYLLVHSTSAVFSELQPNESTTLLRPTSTILNLSLHWPHDDDLPAPPTFPPPPHPMLSVFDQRQFSDFLVQVGGEQCPVEFQVSLSAEGGVQLFDVRVHLQVPG